MGLVTRNLGQLKEDTRRVASESRAITQPVRTDTRGGGSAPAATGLVFPVKLTVAAGINGTATGPCTFSYHVRDVFTDELLVDLPQFPTTAPHQWRRPSVGWMSSASFGLAYTDSNDQLAILWINEAVGQEACV